VWVKLIKACWKGIAVSSMKMDRPFICVMTSKPVVHNNVLTLYVAVERHGINHGCKPWKS